MTPFARLLRSALRLKQYGDATDVMQKNGVMMGVMMGVIRCVTTSVRGHTDQLKSDIKKVLLILKFGQSMLV